MDDDNEDENSLDEGFEQEENSSSSGEGNGEDDEQIILRLDDWLLLDHAAVQQEEESSSSEDEGDHETIEFDSSLPSAHSYLGEGMEDLHGRTIHDANDIVTLPLLLLPGVTLVPNQTVPLHLFTPQSISMMKKVLQADKTFGLLNYHRPVSNEDRDNWPRSHMTRPQTANVGTTAEIFSVKEEEEYGVVNLIMKAEGRQRFKVLEVKRQLDGVLLGKVKILEDARIPPLPEDCLVCNYKRKPNYMSSKLALVSWTASNYRFGSGSKIATVKFPDNFCKTAQTPLSALPYWVYRQYDPLYLMDQIMDEMREWNRNLETSTIPTEPNEFSHWITSNLPFDDTIRISLLEIDCPIVRLRKQLDFIRKCSRLQCCECGNPIADKKDLFSMSQKGPSCAYVNPGGYVHATVTFYKAKGLQLRGRASSENSWFPGYAWTIAECGICSHHMGWKFTVCKKGLTPSKFWGLTMASLTPIISS